MLVAWLQGMYFSDTPEVSPVVITLLSDHWKFKSLSLKIRWFISYSTGNSRNSWNQNKNTIVCIDGRLREFLMINLQKFVKSKQKHHLTRWYVLKSISGKHPIVFFLDINFNTYHPVVVFVLISRIEFIIKNSRNLPS